MLVMSLAALPFPQVPFCSAYDTNGMVPKTIVHITAASRSQQRKTSKSTKINRLNLTQKHINGHLNHDVSPGCQMDLSRPGPALLVAPWIQKAHLAECDGSRIAAEL